MGPEMGRRRILTKIGQHMTESRLADRPAAFWDAVGFDYSAAEIGMGAILQKHDLTQGELNYARQKFGWTRRRKTPQVNRKQIIKRLFRLLDRAIAKLEEEMTTVGDKEVAVLSRLVQSMGKLIEIEAAGGPNASPRETRDMHDIRSKLVARIEELKRS